MDALFDDGFVLRLFPLAQKDIVIADIEAGHHVVAEAPDRFEPEQAAVEIFGLL